MPRHFKTVGLVAPFFPPLVGGANRYCFELAKALAAKGFEVHVFTPAGATQDPSYVLHPVLTRNLGTDLEVLASYQMDIWHSLFFFYAPLALKKRNVFLTAHGDDCFSFQVRLTLPGASFVRRVFLWRLGSRLQKRVEGFVLSAEKMWNYVICLISLFRIRHLVTVSSFTTTQLIRRYPITRKKITVVPPGVSNSFFQDHNLRQRKNRLLTVSRLDEADRIKNIHSVINALVEIKDDYDFEYVIIGGDTKGNYRQELHDLVTANGLSSRIKLEGRKSDVELAEYYQNADLFVLIPYAERNNFEGFGIVFLEANASGVPVLTSREGGMQDYVKEGMNGYFAETTTPAGIRAALAKFLGNEITFDAETVKRFPESFRWSCVADRIAAIYSQEGVLKSAGQ